MHGQQVAFFQGQFTVRLVVDSDAAGFPIAALLPTAPASPTEDH